MAAVEEVNFPWAIEIGKEDAAALAPLRLVAGIEVAEAGHSIWIRGKPCGDSLGTKLAALPAQGRYELLGLNQLRRVDQRVPSARLPDLRWQPLSEWLRLELPVSALPASEPVPARLPLVRSEDEREPELLLTALSTFRSFVLQAALVRLERLQFAADTGGRVLVRGRPLPPLPGQRFVLHHGVAVAAGLTWEPAVSSEVVARRFGASEEALILWHEDGSITRLHREQFIPVTRSAVLETDRELDDSL